MPRYRISISSPSNEAMADLVRKYKIHVIDHSIRYNEGIGHTVEAIVQPNEIQILEAAGYSIQRHEDVDELGKTRQMQVGKDNRYKATGRGPSLNGETRDASTSYLNTEEVETALSVATSTPYSEFTQLITLPNPTWENRQCHAIKIANGSNSDRPSIYFLGGIHAREWGSSDILINFIEQIERAYLTNTGLRFGDKSFSSSDIQSIINTLDIIVFPQANPDGRDYSMNSDAMWRKNRRILSPNSNSGGDPPGSCVGVDLNRNYDFLWDFPDYYAPFAPIVDSTDPCDYELYNGATAFSEPESKNAKWIFDTFPNIGFFIDMHSYSEDILYSWGDDDDQTTDPNMNFQNPAYNALRGIIDASGLAGASDYKEYIPSPDLSLAIDLANIIRDGIQAVRGRAYTVKSSANLYPTAGTSDDYAYSRHFLDIHKRNVIAYTIEWGSPDNPTPFHPHYSEMQNIIQENTSGLIAFCLQVSNLH